jgi:nicotinamide phosphoribosyltransferase
MYAAILCDAYKFCHPGLFPKGYTKGQGNFTPRSTKHFQGSSKYDGKIVVAGVLQGLNAINHAWNQFFEASWEEVESVIRPLIEATTPNADLTIYSDLHKLGYLPIQVHAVEEGRVVRAGTPIILVDNTHEDFAWLASYTEDHFSNELWPACTVATIAREYRIVAEKYAALTADDNGYVTYQCHDFSLRGLFGMWAGYKTGPSMLSAFTGTDNIPGCLAAMHEYGATKADFGSIMATEHSLTTLNIQMRAVMRGCSLFEAEVSFLSDYLDNVGPISYVMDSYDYFGMLEHGLPLLKDKILAREGGPFVVRPDSGVPKDIICGTVEVFEIGSEAETEDHAKGWIKDYVTEMVYDETAHGEPGRSEVSGVARWNGELYRYTVDIEWNRRDKQFYYMDGKKVSKFEPTTLTVEEKGSIQWLWELFGGTVNSKGYKVLNPKIRLIYGDSITIQRFEAILQRLMEMGFSAENIVVGVGSYSIQHITRDSLGFAMKLTYGEVNGLKIDVYKAPKTDTGKHSAKGWLAVEFDEAGEYIPVEGKPVGYYGVLNCAYRNSQVLSKATLVSVRTNLTESLPKAA